jgi:hypothetical protein
MTPVDVSQFTALDGNVPPFPAWLAQRQGVCPGSGDNACPDLDCPMHRLTDCERAARLARPPTCCPADQPRFLPVAYSSS